jgi:hybrid cluster-associated redox disulfide protein
MLLEKYPQAVRVFYKLGMQCPGCPAEGFHTLEEATRAHNRDPEVFFQELEQELFFRK